MLCCDVLCRRAVLCCQAYFNGTLLEALQVSGAADVLVGMHGAGITHVLFMRPGTTVLQVCACVCGGGGGGGTGGAAAAVLGPGGMHGEGDCGWVHCRADVGAGGERRRPGGLGRPGRPTACLCRPVQACGVPPRGNGKLATGVAWPLAPHVCWCVQVLPYSDFQLEWPLAEDVCGPSQVHYYMHMAATRQVSHPAGRMYI